MRKNTFLVLLVGAMLLASCGKKAEQQKAPIRVETAVISAADGSDGPSYVGVVEEREATAVSFTAMGVIKRMLVDEGQMVSRGQLLAEIDGTTMRNSVEMAEATTRQARDMVRQAEDAYAQAKDAYDRMKILHDNGSLPEIKWVEVETRLKQAETALNTARAGVASAQAAEQIARKGMADTRLIAPVSGVIGRRQLNVGETALPSQAVVTILDISSVKVKVSVPEAEVKNIHADSPSMITVAAINKGFAGGRIEKGVQADVMTHTYDLRINVANPNHLLLPGMVASVQLPGADGNVSSGIRVPITAVQQRVNGGSFVWTIDAQNKAHRTEVGVGPTIGNHIAITNGLFVGDRIVTEGYQKLSEGTHVVF
ncbi:MAG: efflux RND transporter periplasmic adaptor subunit [Muribaculaceae bacterium]|nr:efflux RND transporter periplasmic adaptor subunit [Muribaculaceae bacterium]